MHLDGELILMPAVASRVGRAGATGCAAKGIEVTAAFVDPLTSMPLDGGVAI